MIADLAVSCLPELSIAISSVNFCMADSKDAEVKASFIVRAMASSTENPSIRETEGLMYVNLVSISIV